MADIDLNKLKEIDLSQIQEIPSAERPEEKIPSDKVAIDLPSAGQTVKDYVVSGAKGIGEDVRSSVLKTLKASPEEQLTSTIMGADPVGIIPALAAAGGGLKAQIEALKQGKVLNPQAFREAAEASTRPLYEAQEKAPALSTAAELVSSAFIPGEKLVGEGIKNLGKVVTGLGTAAERKVARDIPKVVASKNIGLHKELLRDPNLVRTIKEEGLFDSFGNVEKMAEKARPQTEAAGKVLSDLHEKAGRYNPDEIISDLRKQRGKATTFGKIESKAEKQVEDVISVLEEQKKKAYIEDIKSIFPDATEDNIVEILRSTPISKLEKEFGKRSIELPLQELADLRGSLQRQYKAAKIKDPSFSEEMGQKVTDSLRDIEHNIHKSKLSPEEFDVYEKANKRYTTGKHLEDAAEIQKTGNLNVTGAPSISLYNIAGNMIPRVSEGMASRQTTGALQTSLLDKLSSPAQKVGKAFETAGENILQGRGATQLYRQATGKATSEMSDAIFDPRTKEEKQQSEADLYSKIIGESEKELRVIESAKNIKDKRVRDFFIQRQLGEKRGQEIINELETP